MLKTFAIFTLKVAAATFLINIVDGYTGIFSQARSLLSGFLPGPKA
jgi:hypothetical protein